MSRKRIGEIVEAKVMTDLLACGVAVATPWGDDEAYDLVADINGKFVRIQVKASRTRSNGDAFSFSCTRNKYFKNGKWLHQQYEEGETDYFATSWGCKSYMIPASECGQEKQLRIREPKNNMKKYINWAKDYELERVVERLKTDL